MTALYYITPTQYGRSLIALAHDQANIALKDLVVGDALDVPYDPVVNVHRTNLVNQRASVPIQTVSVSPNGADTVRVTAVIPNTVGGFNLHEIGLTDTTGKLVYIGNWHGGYKPALTEGAQGEILLNIDIQVASGAQALIKAVNAVTANQEWVTENFIHKDEFNQYFNAFAEATWHVGYKIFTANKNWNPSVALAPFFGYPTTWYLSPYVPVGVTEEKALGQLVNFTNGQGTQGETTRIWQRYADGSAPPTYQLTASTTQINEGDEITFTLQTTGLAEGTPVDWKITKLQGDFNVNDITPAAINGSFVVGPLGVAQYEILIKADNLTEGTEKFRFALSHVSGMYCDVIINDTSVEVEKIIYINQSTSDLNLLSLYTTQYGAPNATTKARFVIGTAETPVEIVASTTEKYALTMDAAWQGEILVDNYGYLLGRGGRGGRGGYWNSDESGGHTAPLAGEDGGTALLINYPITINNYLLIAGGGGGGGGGGLWPSTSDHAKRNSAMGGGGAPYGAPGSPANEKYIDHFEGVIPSEATLLMGGAGGQRPYSSYNNTYGGSGGAGGDIGISGLAGNADHEGWNGDYAWQTPMEPEPGGQAGYVFTGSSTPFITNIGSGQTKGRT